MFGRRLAVGVGVAALVFSALSTSVASAADNGAQKVGLLNHAFELCHGSGAGTPQDGFAIFNLNGDGTVSATVSLKNGPADAVYDVRLIQPYSTNGGCPTNVGTLTTNGEGNGNVHVDVPEGLLVFPPFGPADAYVALFPLNTAASLSGEIDSLTVAL